MAINLASKFSNKIVERFTVNSFLMGHTNQDYNWDGVRSITVYTPKTVDLSTYDRTASTNRFGTPQEMQDTIQTLTLTQEPSYSITIDKGNNIDQMMIKNAGRMMNLQIAEKVTPFMDKYAFKTFVHNAGTIKGITAPAKNTIVGIIFDAATSMDNALVPMDKRTLFLKASYYNMLRQSSEFLAVDDLATKALVKGLVGEIADMQVIKVPDSYLPDNVYFMVTHKRSILMPTKLKTARILTDVAGIDGAVLEGRNYFDAFVLGTRCDGVYTAAAAADVLAAPTIAIASNSATITLTSGASGKYTTDGTDPRYSPTAAAYASAVTLISGQTIRAYQYQTGKLASAVADKTNS